MLEDFVDYDDLCTFSLFFYLFGLLVFALKMIVITRKSKLLFKTELAKFNEELIRKRQFIDYKFNGALVFLIVF